MLDQATRLRELAEQHCDRPQIAQPYIITVASGKGGVGKSTVALNLAIRLAEMGNQTMLLDADENLGNIDVMAGVSPTLRLGDVLRGTVDIEDALVSPMHNISILAGNSGEPDYPKMTMAKQQELLCDIADLDQRFRYLVIDASAGIGEEIVNLAVHSHETLVVTVPEPTALMDAYALIKMITLADPLVPLNIVVNSARTADEGAETACKLQMVVKRFLERDLPCAGIIPYDANVSKAIVHQKAVISEFPATPATISLSRIAERLIQQSSHKPIKRFKTA